jgi:acid phosphatase type 7
MKRFAGKMCFSLLLLFLFNCASDSLTVKQVMDNVVTRLYSTKNETELNSLDDAKIMQLLTETEKQVLATKYWTFDVNVPVIVSVMRHVDQQVVPFWLELSGFSKSNLTVRNQKYKYEIWQKEFQSGKVELGINGFGKHRPVYFVSVGAKNPKDELKLLNIFPNNQYVSSMQNGSFIYHDWDELVLQDVPESLVGHKLLTTIRGRAREAHLLNAFRKTPFPSSEKPDQILLTWSEDPKTTQTFQWRTNTTIENGVVKYWVNNEEKALSTTAEKIVLEDRLLQNDRYIHRFTATVNNLKPGTAYNYKVGNAGQNSWSETAEFKTAPSDNSPFTFVYFGDVHRSPHWGRLINSAYERHPETAFYTISGDLVSTGLYRDDWDHLFDYSKKVINKRPLMTTLGNHDEQDGLGAGMYFDLFELPKNGPENLVPEKAYAFEYSNALFLELTVTGEKGEQDEWIEKQLSQSTATWKFAIFHFPPYSYEEDYPVIRKKWGDLFDKYHVDMVMSGHVHYYMRSKPMYNQKPVASPKDGTIYLISIGIPNRAGNFPPSEWVDVRFGGEMLYQTFDINDDKLVMRTRNIEGEVRDELVIEK